MEGEPEGGVALREVDRGVERRVRMSRMRRTGSIAVSKQATVTGVGRMGLQHLITLGWHWVYNGIEREKKREKPLIACRLVREIDYAKYVDTRASLSRDAPLCVPPSVGAMVGRLYLLESQTRTSMKALSRAAKGRKEKHEQIFALAPETHES